jgi:uncharacterized membrane protein YphA (DoxX/SURF4 family)
VRLSLLRSRPFQVILTLCFFLLATPFAAHAHVKWFSDFSFTDPPTSLGDAITPTFIALTVLSMAALGALVLVDARLKQAGWYQRVIQWFENRREYAPLALRIGMGMTLMLAWQADTLLTPDLALPAEWVGWLQFLLALLLIFRMTTPIAGIGVIALYLIGIGQYGAFYMLDYFVFVGVGVYLIVTYLKDERIRALRIPALYFSVGFSLLWLGLEKIIYPQWSLYILEQNPQLTLGFEMEFFLIGAAFVELVLGYLLLIGLLERPIAVLITFVFFLTTLVFGKVEVIGHTILHAALIVFLLEGPGRFYPAPINIHQRLPLRVAFASVNFLLVLIILILPYAAVAQRQYELAIAEQDEQTTEETAYGDLRSSSHNTTDEFISLSPGRG